MNFVKQHKSEDNADACSNIFSRTNRTHYIAWIFPVCCLLLVLAAVAFVREAAFNSHADFYDMLNFGSKSKATPMIEAQLNFTAPPVPSKSPRVPQSHTKFTVNLWEHPDLLETIQAMPPEDQDLCIIQGNIDIWSSEPQELERNLLNPPDGLNLFQMDCRDAGGRSVIALVVILTHKGYVPAVLPLNKDTGRAESLTLKDTNTVVVAAKRGVLLWSWKDGTVQMLPANPDTHSLWYSNKYGAFYGMLSVDTPSAFMSNGEQVFRFLSTGRSEAHLNFLSFSDDAAYLSSRFISALQKVDRATQTVEWTMGGPNSMFTVKDFNGQIYPPQQGAWNGPWSFQHKFQHLSDNYFSLFDNHVDSTMQFIDGKTSRMVVLRVNIPESYVEEVFSFDTGDQAVIYGGTDVLPSGNILGSSYPDIVYPAVEDFSYHQNIWEVSQEGNIVWRAALKGKNPRNRIDSSSPYSHRLQLEKEPPVGWVVYNVERFYEKPTISIPCKDDNFIRFQPFNTIRTVEELDGLAVLSDETDASRISEANFQFQKSWVEQPFVRINLPIEKQHNNLVLEIYNIWQDRGYYPIGTFAQMMTCGE